MSLTKNVKKLAYNIPQNVCVSTWFTIVFRGYNRKSHQISAISNSLSSMFETKMKVSKITLKYIFIKGQVENAENAENAEKDEKVLKCEKSCLLNQNMGKKPL